MMSLYLENNLQIPMFIFSTTYKYRTYSKKFRLQYPTVSNSIHECEKSTVLSNSAAVPSS